MEGSPLLHWGIEAVRGWCYNMATASLRPLFYLNYLDMEKWEVPREKLKSCPSKGFTHLVHCIGHLILRPGEAGGVTCAKVGLGQRLSVGMYQPLFLEFIPLGGSV